MSKAQIFPHYEHAFITGLVYSAIIEKIPTVHENPFNPVLRVTVFFFQKTGMVMEEWKASE